MFRERNVSCSTLRNRMILSVPPLLALCVCGAQCGSSLGTAELPALEVATVNKLSDDNNYDAAYCLDLVPYGASEGLKYGTARVGYNRKHDPGAAVFPCWWWLSSVDRGLARFDLALLGTTADKIVDATLEYDLQTTYSVSNTATNCPHHILTSLWLMNEPWSDNFYPNAEFLTNFDPSPNCVVAHHSWSVTSVVRDWLKGTRPNYGFLLVGADESMPSEQNGEHRTTLSNFKLRVLVAMPAAGT